MGEKEFKRQGSEHKHVKDSWRKPKGGDSKMRKEKKDKPAIVKVGYRKPKSERDIHPSGYREELVHNLQEAKEVDPETHAIRIGSRVGGRKREEILKYAEEQGIKVLNDRREKRATENSEETSG